MKTGILTFHDVDNYGAVLQAYALQQTLKKLGIDNEFVAIERVKKDAPQITAKGPMAAFARKLKEAGEERSRLFEKFREDCMEISSLYSQKELGELEDAYAYFLAGSDQVWNVRIPDVDPRYFLTFASPEKRCSYAASFGSGELPDQVASWCGKQLEQFAHISVREESGKELIKRLTEKQAKVHVDPTLLLERVDWERISEELEEEYVLLFLLNYDEEAVKLAKAEAEKRNVGLKVVTAAFLPQLGMDAWCKTGVRPWISLMRNARYVVTNSFHGTVFSIIFEREFCAVPLKGELSSRNGRIRELLDKTGLSAGRDYDYAKQVIGRMRLEALSYLKELGNVYGVI